MVFWAIY